MDCVSVMSSEFSLIIGVVQTIHLIAFRCIALNQFIQFSFVHL